MLCGIFYFHSLFFANRQILSTNNNADSVKEAVLSDSMSNAFEKVSLDNVQKSTSKKCVTMTSFIDSIDHAEYLRINELLISHIISNNLDFDIAESTYFCKFVQALRPAYKPPNSEILKTNLLDDFYQQYTTKNTITDCSGILLISCQQYKNVVQLHSIVLKSTHLYLITLFIGYKTIILSN